MSSPAPNPLQPLLTQMTALCCKIDSLMSAINAQIGAGNGGGTENGGQQPLNIITSEKKATQAQIKTISIGTMPTLIAASNSKRLSISIVNLGAGTVYLGDDKNITEINGSQPGFSLPTNGAVYDDKFVGDIYGVSAAGSNTVAVWENIE